MVKINLKSVVISIIVISSMVVAVLYLFEKSNEKVVATVELSDNYRIVAGVIRNAGGGWELIQDATHETIGIRGVEQNEDRIIVRYDESSKVNSMAVTADETMSSEGYTAGASVGISETWVYIYDRNGDLVPPNEYKSSTGNIWIQGIFKK